MPRGLRQAFQIGREAFLLGAWRNRVGAHDQHLTLEKADREVFPLKVSSL